MGCVIAEMILMSPLFKGKTRNEQLKEIIKVLGTPSAEEIKEMNPDNKKVYKITSIVHKKWEDVFKGKTEDRKFMDLIDKLLVYVLYKRINSYQAMEHEYFKEIKERKKELPKHLFEFTESEKKMFGMEIERLIC